MKYPAILMLCLSAALHAGAAPVWTARVEEPTGLYPRTNEIVSVPRSRLGTNHQAFIVTDTAGQEQPWQLCANELLFPVSLIPGELPEYHIAPVEKPAGEFANRILLRKLGMHRVELGNRWFRVVVDTRIPAILEAYSLSAGPQRMLNLVETTPENDAALKNDIHKSTPAPPESAGAIAGENTGWTSLGADGPMTDVKFLERGPLRGRVQLERTNETWELTWTADSAALRWRARQGFRFAAVSAEPYLPFDRFVEGSEYHWPNGPDEEEPPAHEIAPRAWTKLPGGHAVYYRQLENYGALGLIALDPDLNWKGIGSRRFQAEKESGVTEIALTFPGWNKNDTVLAARRENRVLRQPVLVSLSGPEAKEISISTPAAREPTLEWPDASVPGVPFAPPILSLDGPWELAWAEKGAGAPRTGWRTVKVPGSAQVQWLEPSRIYSHDTEWISGKEWWFRKRFALPETLHNRRLRLEFEATDYYADAWLNGAYLGRHEGYIDPYFYEVNASVKPREENELLVRVWAPVNYYWKHRSYTVKGSYGGVDQKPDDITALGITRSVRLVGAAETVIDDIAVATWLGETHAVGTNETAPATVEVQLSTDGPLDPEYWWELTLSPRNFASPDRLRVKTAVAGQSTWVVMPVKNPRLWWTWDHGEPNLYTLEVTLMAPAGRVLDRKILAVGIREIEKEGWNFYLNRKRLFIRGSNYYYHLYLSEMNRAAYARDLGLMRQMNVNMIRLHCHFTNREFYDLADEQGVLLWQDFLEAWYPQDRRFSLRASALYDPLIRYARNHPSIALWTTSDEEDLENYRDLTKHLAPRPATLDPQRRPVVRSTGRYGDAHVYHGWYGGSIWEYQDMEEEFVSELGATSLPNYDTLIEFLPDHWPIKDHPDEWFFRRLQIPEALKAWGDPSGLSLRDYVPQTQAYVSRLFQIALEKMRRSKYHPAGGILHFHAIDIWPSVTMAAIDFNRRPTKVFDTVRRSFEPVAALFEYRQDHWRAGDTFRCGVWAVNDRWEAIPEAVVRWRILDKAGKTQAEGEWPVSMPEDSSTRLGEVTWTTAAPGAYQLRAEVRAKSGQTLSENVFEFGIGISPGLPDPMENK